MFCFVFRCEFLVGGAFDDQRLHIKLAVQAVKDLFDVIKHGCILHALERVALFAGHVRPMALGVLSQGATRRATHPRLPMCFGLGAKVVRKPFAHDHNDPRFICRCSEF